MADRKTKITAGKMKKQETEHPEKQESKRTLVTLEVERCFPTASNPRTFDARDPEFLALVEDVRVNEVLQPVLACEREEHFEVLAGERRLQAAIKAGLKTIPALLYEGLTDADKHKLTVKENFSRENLKPLEEAKAVRLMLDDMGGDLKAAASFFGKTERWVQLRAKLLDLSKEWKTAAADPGHAVNRWSAAHLELIARFDKQTQDRMFQGMRNDVPTVKDLENYINQNYVRLLAKAAWPKDDATLTSAGACTACAKRSSCQGKLFIEDGQEETPKTDRCLDEKCWAEKGKAYVLARANELKAKHSNLVFVEDKNASYHETSAMRERIGTTIINEYSYTRAKKPKEGEKTTAVPALVVSGRGSGDLIWINPPSSSSRTSSKAAGEKKPTSMAERRKMLDSKRWFETLKVLADAIDTLDLQMLPKREPIDLIRLASVFGTIDQEVNYGKPAWDLFNKCDDGDAMDCLWALVRAVLAQRLAYNGPITQVPAGLCEEAKRTAELCGIDLAAIRTAAETTYPEPKGWKMLNADGTKKTAAKKETQHPKGAAGGVEGKRKSSKSGSAGAAGDAASEHTPPTGKDAKKKRNGAGRSSTGKVAKKILLSCNKTTCEKHADCAHGKKHVFEEGWCIRRTCYDVVPYEEGGVQVMCVPVD